MFSSAAPAQLSQVVNQAVLTVSGITAANKVYNANTTATLNTTGATLVGVFSGDTVTLNTSGATGTFASQNVGTGITVTVAGLTISGAQAGDYTLTQPTTTANITPAGLTVSGITAANKVYDANTTATLNTAGATLVGVFSGDTVTLSTSGATGTFASKDVGTGITVTVAGLTISGAQAGDYTLTQPTTTANITPAGLTVSGITAANKVYNANTTATLNTSGATLVGVFSGDTVTLNTSGATGTFASQGRGDRHHGDGGRADDRRGAGRRLHADAADDDGEHHAGWSDGLGHHGREQGVRCQHDGHAEHVGRDAGGRVQRRYGHAQYRRRHRDLRLARTWGPASR